MSLGIYFEKFLMLARLKTRNLLQASAINSNYPINCAYAGFDPTAHSLHLGNLCVLIALLHAQISNINVIALIGGATGLIGDPSGKLTARSLLSPSALESNKLLISSQIRQIFNNMQVYASQFHSFNYSPIQIVDNLSWYQNLNVLDFLSSLGRHFRVGSMLQKDSVKSRLESSAGLSFTEFSYQLLQANDFLHLYKSHNCNLQIGASDQWGNITAGIELVRKDLGQHVHGLVIPLLLASDGSKFGKSNGNAIWLDTLNVFALYQYFFQAPDAKLLDYFLVFTLLPLSDIHSILAKHTVLFANVGKPQGSLWSVYSGKSCDFSCSF